MRYNQKQEKIEEKTYHIIDELADEFDLDVPFYPEVYWVGRKKKFESLGLPEPLEDLFDEIKKEKKAVYLYGNKIILTATKKKGYIAEEAGHFLHFENSKIDPLKNGIENPKDNLSLRIIDEAIGFFCSKFIYSGRKNPYAGYENFRDFIEKNLDKNGVKYKNLDLKVWENIEKRDDFFVYKNGYDLGEELFNHYISGNIKKNQIRKLIKSSFKEPFSATEKFLYLRKKLMRYSYLNGHAKLNGQPKTLKINSIIL